MRVQKPPNQNKIMLEKDQGECLNSVMYIEYTDKATERCGSGNTRKKIREDIEDSKME